MASEIYGVAYDDCKEKYPDGTPNPEGKNRRDSVKSILLGLMYSMTMESIAESLDVSKDEAQRIVDMLFGTFPAIKKVVDYYMEMAKEKGYISTVYGRKCRLPDIQLPQYEFVHTDNKDTPIEDEAIITYYWNRLKKIRYHKDRKLLWEEANARGVWIIDNNMKISDAERQVLNSVIQGTSADITKIAMLRIGQDESLRQWEFDMLLTIHDEIDGECPEEYAIKSNERISEIMIGSCADKITTPMKVDVDIARVWTGEDITEELKQKYVS